MTSSHRHMKLAALLALYALLFALGHFGAGWLARWIGFDPTATSTSAGMGVLVTGLVVYALLLAIPFIPGMEISIALFAAFGTAAAIPIYCATVIALMAAFAFGQFVPPRLVGGLFRRLGLQSAEALVTKLEPLTPSDRLSLLIESAPNRLVPTLIRYRYLAFIVAVNTPGNAVMGGGGGLALIAGLTGLFDFPRFLLAICVAVLPVPLAAFLSGRLF